MSGIPSIKRAKRPLIVLIVLLSDDATGCDTTRAVAMDARAVGRLGQVEDDGMRMELRRRIAVHRPGTVMFKERSDRLAGRFGTPVPAKPRLHIRLQRIERHPYALAVGLPHAPVPANKRGNRHPLGAENVASHPARCSIVVAVSPRAFRVSQGV
jgi:hypothetical protein